MPDRISTRLRWDPRVRRGKMLARATLSPAGIVSGGVVAGIGVLAGIGLPWILGAAGIAWLTSIVLHLRDPGLVGRLLAPEFDRDLSVLDDEHLQYVSNALSARDRFEGAIADLPDRDDFGGMRARVTEAIRRLYDSAVWAQRAARFLESVDDRELRDRLSSLPPSSPIAEELREQLEEVDTIGERRRETLARIAATTTGIETMAVKMASFALGSSAPGWDQTSAAEVRRMREELDTYVDALAEVEKELPGQPPPQLA